MIRFKSSKIAMILSSLFLVTAGLSFSNLAISAENNQIQVKKNQADSNTYEFNLKNGLKLIVKEDHRSPVVVSQIWYKVGSIDEYYGKTGLSHLLEHLMFLGTPNYKDFSKMISNIGGRDNAFTSRDHTVYFEQFHKDHLELALKLEADRMVNLYFDEEKFKKELNVVKEERRLRTEDKPSGLLYENFMATAYPTNTYRNPVIGWMRDLDNVKMQDAQNWYKTWYAPNNATIVIVGDVNPQNTYQLVDKYFSNLEHKKLPERHATNEEVERIDGRREIIVKAESKNPSLIMGYPVPVLKDIENDIEPYALEMLDSILDGHDSARLVKSLTQDLQIANSIDADYDSVSRGSGLFTIAGTPRENKTVAELEKAIKSEIEKIKKNGITQAELDRAKSQLMAQKIFQQDSLFYQAMSIGELHTVGFNHKDQDIMLKKLQAVTKEQIQNVAKKYFNDDALTIAILQPQTSVKKVNKTPFSTSTGRNHSYEN